MAEDEVLPKVWPVDPQEDVPVSKDRIWVDGCFDFSHHGHAGAMLQARQLGKQLLVGVHSDEEILENKGPTVMTLEERIIAVDACRWSTQSIPQAPYVTSLPWISHYGCYYVVHGDDITSDSSGQDCYRHVKAAGRFLVVKRTPGISTTDLVGRMLLYSKSHYIKSLSDVLEGKEGSGGPEEKLARGNEYMQRIKDYATDHTGLSPGSTVWIWDGSPDAMLGPSTNEAGSFREIVAGVGPRPGQRIVYVDGGFDLFSSGHITFLRCVMDTEDAIARKNGWFEESARRKRLEEFGADFSPAFVVAGVHDDEVINRAKGVNYPIMNIFERGLCVLQCRYIHSVVFSAPFTPSVPYLKNLPYGLPDVVYHGPTAFVPMTYDPYSGARQIDIFRQIGDHDFRNVNAGEIVQRILRSREQYEERQRIKAAKSANEAVVKAKEEEMNSLQAKSPSQQQPEQPEKPIPELQQPEAPQPPVDQLA